MPHRAEYHLYVGWAAIETGNVARAERELAEALKIDGTLADAYWQRGVLRARQGAVRDAVIDLVRALELNPARHEVHAALADAYYDLGRERDALTEWQKAVQGKPDNALWRFRYGKLLVVNQMNDGGPRRAPQGHRLGAKAGVAAALALGGPPPLCAQPRRAAGGGDALGAVPAARAARLTLSHRGEASARSPR